MNWTPLNLTVRVGCSLAYETTVPTPVLFVLTSESGVQLAIVWTAALLPLRASRASVVVIPTCFGRTGFMESGMG